MPRPPARPSPPSVFIWDRGCNNPARGAGGPMAAGGECAGSRSLPALRLARLPRAPPAALWCGREPKPSRGRLSLQELRGARAPWAGALPCAAARRDGGFRWTRSARTEMPCPYSSALKDNFPFWRFNICTHFHMPHAFGFNMHGTTVPFCFQFAACFS